MDFGHIVSGLTVADLCQTMWVGSAKPSEIGVVLYTEKGMGLWSEQPFSQGVGFQTAVFRRQDAIDPFPNHR